MQAVSIFFEPLLPWPLIVVFGFLGAAVLLFAFAQRARGTGWRLLALGMLIITLANPALVQEQRKPVKDTAVIIVDRSPSQSLGSRTARTDRVLKDLREKLARFDDLDVRVAYANGENGQETRLFDTLNHAVADLPQQQLAGAILLTDGQVHDVPKDTRDLAGIGSIHTLLTGTPDEVDRRLVVVNAPAYGLVGQDVTVTVRVDDLPVAARGAVTLTLSRNGSASQHYSLPTGVDQEIVLPVEHGGQNVYEFAVENRDGELTALNNHAAVVINGVRDRLKVLLVSGEPHVGERTWRNLLKADPAVDLVHFTILRSPEKHDPTPIREMALIAFPTRELFETKLNDFDLVIFDRYRHADILPMEYLENVAHYVENGGALLEVGGSGFEPTFSLEKTPLGTVLPTTPTGVQLEEPFRPTVTDLGRRHPVTAGLVENASNETESWGRWFHQVDATVRQGSVIMTGAQGRPLLVLDRVGKGRVAQLTSDQIWLWSRGFEGGGPQAELLRRMAHWLMKEPELEEESLRARVDGNHLLMEHHTLDTQSPQAITVTLPQGGTKEAALNPVRPGLAVATLDAAEPGIYRITDGTRTTAVVVGATLPPEWSDVRTTPDRLAPVAKATGGGMLWLSDLQGAISNGPAIRRTRPSHDQAGSSWIGLRANGDYTVTGVATVPLLPALPLLFLTFGTLTLAWWREGR